MSTHIWCEDSGSGFLFWSKLFKALHPEMVVESKAGNSQLRKAVAAIQNDANEYYLLMDSFVDNSDILREIDRLKRCISGRENIHMVDIRSFEFAVLSFQSLAEWVFASDDELKNQRRDLIRARELFVEQVTHEVDLEKKHEFESLFPYALSHNNEQTAAELLYLLTRNTGFETTKGQLGACFMVNCCEWSSRQADDLCGLDKARLSSIEKQRQLVDGSILKSAFEKAGL